MEMPAEYGEIPHPGRVLREYLRRAGVSQAQLARRIDTPANHVGRICRGEVDLTPEMAWRIGTATGVKPTRWMSVQHVYDILNFERFQPENLPDLMDEFEDVDWPRPRTAFEEEFEKILDEEER